MAQCFWDGVELFGTTLGYTGEGPIEENKNKVAKKSRSGEKQIIENYLEVLDHFHNIQKENKNNREM